MNLWMLFLVGAWLFGFGVCGVILSALSMSTLSSDNSRMPPSVWIGLLGIAVMVVAGIGWLWRAVVGN